MNWIFKQFKLIQKKQAVSMFGYSLFEQYISELFLYKGFGYRSMFCFNLYKIGTI